MLAFWNVQKSAALYASRHNEAVLALDRALGHLDKNEGNLGLLWLGRALELAPPAAADLQFVIRSNLSPWLARAPTPRAIVSHGDEVVTAAALSPDGRTAASGCYRKALLWDAQTGRLRGSPLTHEGHVWWTGFSPDGRLLVTTSGDQQKGGGEVKFWDAQTGDPQGVLPKFAGEAREAYFSRDSRLLLTIAGGEAQVWDVTTRAPLTKPLVHGEFIMRRRVQSGWQVGANLWRERPGGTALGNGYRVDQEELGTSESAAPPRSRHLARMADRLPPGT